MESPEYHTAKFKCEYALKLRWLYFENLSILIYVYKAYVLKLQAPASLYCWALNLFDSLLYVNEDW